MANYHRLALSDRYQIIALIESGLSIRATAKTLGRSPSTISRELKRNCVKKYNAKKADKLAFRRRSNIGPPKKINMKLSTYICQKLEADWSPQQISGRLLRMKSPISHETIYQFIYRDFRYGGTLYSNLVRKRKRRISRAESRRTKILRNHHRDENWIDYRPKIVDERVRIGDYERDTILGKIRGPVLLTIVDRVTRHTTIRKLPRVSSWLTHEETVEALQERPLKTITNDNGAEFKDSLTTGLALGISVYFNKPYSSWQRGTNENTNGLIRRYFPKGTDFSNITDEQIRRVEMNLNTRPRKVLGYKTPLEVQTELNRNVALST